MTITSVFNTDKLFDAIRSFPGKTDVELDKFLTDNVRLLVSNSRGSTPGLLQITPPSSQGTKGKAAQLQGVKRVTADIAKVYRTSFTVWQEIAKINANMAKGYRAASLKGDIVRMNSIAARVPGLIAWAATPAKAFDGGAEAKVRRAPNTGRVAGKYPSFTVSNPDALKKWRTEKVKRVGMLASMIPAAAGFKLGKIPGVPTWIKNQKNTSGATVTDKRGAKSHFFRLNLEAYATIEMQRRMNYALSYRINAIEKQVPFVIRKLEKKLQSAINAA